MKRNLFFVLLLSLFAFGFGLSLQAQTEEATQDCFPVGAKWYYQTEEVTPFSYMPDRDKNKDEWKIGFFLYEVIKEENLGTEIKKTITRTRYNHLKEIDSVSTFYLYLCPNGDLWGEDEGAARNLFHSPSKKIGDKWPVTIRYRSIYHLPIDGVDAISSTVTLNDIYEDPDGCITYYYILRSVTPEEGSSFPYWYICREGDPLSPSDRIYPIGGFFVNFWYADLPMREDEEIGARAYVAPDGTVYETDWWKRNPFHDIGIDGVYHRPLALPVVQNPEGWYRYDRLSGVAVSEVSGQLYLYGMDGRLVRMGHGQVSTLGLPTGIYVLKSMDNPHCYAKILVE
ncbi:Uncharacterised protein [Porphyromonas crevioricanis]|uniref:Por secretion system C-terminal sorting domain n=2 Tax=Porphyromonas crevioricanis TaxID=393921 RepID=A0A2X4PYZ2_9PORP|nr:hypothetical protein [Porphyromonas crevioricanis]SQH73127.1 Uncharacterised protein [Porphyromonas crevioricanis]